VSREGKKNTNCDASRYLLVVFPVRLFIGATAGKKKKTEIVLKQVESSRNNS
jgi:hypothetical protein